MVKIHHLNCGTLYPLGLFPLSTLPVNGTGRLFGKGLGVLHCLLVDTGAGLALVDTGYGMQDIQNPTSVVKWFNRALGFRGDIRETALQQVIDLGYLPENVRHIFLTHMHLDHTGGLPDFPRAKVHVYQPEYQAAIAPSGMLAWGNVQAHWAHEPEWCIYRVADGDWLGLESTPPVKIGAVSFRFVPMVGHSPGHSCVVLELPEGRWIVHAGDAYFYHGQVAEPPFDPPYAKLVHPLLKATSFGKAAFKYTPTLRAIHARLGERVVIFNSHDPYEFEKLSGQKVRPVHE